VSGYREGILEATSLSPGLVGVGRIIDLGKGGEIWVDFAGSPPGGARSRILRHLLPITRKNIDDTVLLVFESENPLPVIVGIVADGVCPILPQVAVELEGREPETAVIDGKRVLLRAYEEIRLECGKASIIARKDGKIILRGVEIVSRASKTNKIRGASVQIN
jgi:hypothetical protein